MHGNLSFRILVIKSIKGKLLNPKNSAYPRKGLVLEVVSFKKFRLIFRTSCFCNTACSRKGDMTRLLSYLPSDGLSVH
ncbi:hypothetical protein AUF14_16595 [Enterococcus avium]|nr:hypothetical protein AUF14_16595 [Enterococcus avium]QCQ11591.1 hypothetical protein EH197_05095 [Enterococcus avium]RGY40092.1 hypothetical protein DXA45_13235 [Enterococcus avium]ROZ45170.1 hypothetical protein EGX28_06105 [Enterococcus avium]TXV48607.1 hypothetical protein D4M89_04345 [Enterococcus sp. T0101B.F-10]